MHRVCFTMRIALAHLARYELLHREAWPELLVELDRAGWRDYSLFLRDDGALVGYLESPDWPRARAEMARSEVSARWSAEMDRLVVPGSRMRWPALVATTGGERPLGAEALREVAVAGSVAALGPAPAEPGTRSATFRDADGVAVRYLERPAGAVAAEPAAFRRVFDLEGQLAAVRSAR